MDSLLVEGHAALADAQKLERAGKYAAAIARAQQALALEEAALDKASPEIAGCAHLLGELYRRLDDFSKAAPLLQRALSIRETALGANHPDVATSLQALGDLYAAQSQYGQAEAAYRRALAIQEAALGLDRPEVALTLTRLGAFYAFQRKYADADPLYQRALAIQEKVLDKSDPEYAATLAGLGGLRRSQGRYAEAEALVQRALAIQEAAFGKDHPRLADSLNTLGEIYRLQGLYERAVPHYQRALAIWEAALGESHSRVAFVLNNLAVTYKALGLYDRAEPLFQRCLTILEARLGKNHPTIGMMLNNFGLLYKEQGLYRRAEPVYQRSLAILEAAFGKDHPHVAVVLQQLGNLYFLQGLYERAEAFQQRALSIEESKLDQNDLQIAGSLNGLAIVAEAQEHYDRAEQLLQRALAIREAALGKDHPEVALLLSNLSHLYIKQGWYGRAEPLSRRALAIDEGALGKHHPDVSASLVMLADISAHQGEYDRAESLEQRALEIRTATLGGDHPLVGESLNNIARLDLARHRLAGAMPLFRRSFEIFEQRLRREALDFSESRLAGLLSLLRDDEERLYALLREHPEDDRVRRLALAAALLFKGRSVDEAAGISRAILESLSPRDHDAFERLRGLRTQLAKLSLDGPGALTAEEYQQRRNKLAADGDELEADLARRSAPLRARAGVPPPAEIVERVAASLPRDGALIELVAYADRPPIPKRGTRETKLQAPPRYAALVLFPDGRTGALDLGPTASIDAAALRLRDALASRAAGFERDAQALHRLVFKPLSALLGDTRKLFIAPDGQLALVPFAALHDGRRFLADTFDFISLTSGRDLLPRPPDATASSSVVVLADPEFENAASGPDAAAAAAGKTERSEPLERFFAEQRRGLSGQRWTPLAGTRGEAEAIQRLLPQAELHLGAEATKERLLHLSTPGILHIATHGFFLEDGPAPPASRGIGEVGAPADSTRSAGEPLLRSGLVLAGGSAPERLSDSLVTALELAGLNLWGTQLVVLSACDTGRGEVKRGQGVYGLRRALVVAGAETLVVSLWKVNDETTRTMMESYYRNLLAGQGRVAALREAMLSLRAQHPHPHYWAPFIAIGRDAPLRNLAVEPAR